MFHGPLIYLMKETNKVLFSIYVIPATYLLKLFKPMDLTTTFDKL